MASKYKEFCGKWKDGCNSGLCEGATHICFARGSIPADVLFIGEAPGESENVLGVPFIGPAGKLLDRIINKGVPKNLTCALTNLVGCIPRDVSSGNKASEPLPEEVRSCLPRLKEFVGIVKPRLVIAVGELAKIHITGQSMFSDKEHGNLSWLGDGTLEFANIVHPAFILRMNLAQQSLAEQRCVVIIRNAVEDTFRKV